MATNGKKPSRDASRSALNLSRFQEIATRGIQDRLDPDKRARFDEAMRRGLITTDQDPEAVTEPVAAPIAQPEQAPTVATPAVSAPALEVAQVAPAVEEPLIALPEGMDQEQFDVSRQAGGEEFNKQLLEERRVLAAERGLDFDTLSFQEKEALVPKPGFGRKLTEALTGSRRQTEETRELPRLSSLNIGFGKDMQRAIAFVTASSDKERVKMIKDIAPGTSARFDQKGNIIVKLPDGREGVLNKPGFTFTDVLKFGTEAAKFTPATRAAGGLAAGLKLGAKGKVLTQMIGAGLTSSVNEVVSAAVGGDFQPMEIAIETFLAGGGEAVGEALSAFKKSRATRPGTPGAESADLIASGREAGAETGIELFKGQETLVFSDLERQSFVSQLPTGSQTAIKALRKQNEQAANAVTDFLNTIAPADVVENAAVKFRGASERAVEFKKAIRKEFTSPLYQEAFTENPAIDLVPVRDVLNAARLRFPKNSGKFKQAIDEVEGLIKGDIQIIPGSPILDAKGNLIFKETKVPINPTLEQLHGAKVLIDDMVNRTGEDSVGNTAAGILKNAQSALLKQLDSASDAYRIARQQFASETPIVQQTTEGLIGRISKFKDPQLKNISKTIFDTAESNPKVISRIRRTIENQDPKAFGDLLRVEMERRMLTAKPGILESATGAVENIPNQLMRALGFDREGSLRVLRASLNKDQRKNLEFLVVALKRASLGRASGSQTATREEIKKELRGGAMNAIGAFLNPKDTVSGAARDATFDRRAAAMAEAFFDPRWTERVQEIRKMKIGSTSASRAMSQLLNEIDTEQLSETEQPQESQ